MIDLIYEEINDKIIVPFKTQYLDTTGIWGMYGKVEENEEYQCLNVGVSTDVGREIITDLGKLHYIAYRDDGSERYYNQFNEDCGFSYNPGQIHEYLYPFLKEQYNCIKFVLLDKRYDRKVEKEIAQKEHALFWKNGSPFGVTKKPNWKGRELSTIGSYFPDGGESYSLSDLLNMIENDLGYNETEGKKLISKCESLGIIYYMGENIYTR